MPAQCHSQDGWQLNRIKGLTTAQCSQRAEFTMRTGFTPLDCVSELAFLTPFPLHVHVCACGFISNWDLSINATDNKSPNPMGKYWTCVHALVDRRPD